MSRSSEGGDVADVTIGDQRAALRALLALSMKMTAVDDDPEKALARAADLFDDVAVDARILLDAPAGAAWLVRTALAAGDRERAGRVAVQAERLAALNGAIPASWPRPTMHAGSTRPIPSCCRRPERPIEPSARRSLRGRTRA